MMFKRSWGCSLVGFVASVLVSGGAFAQLAGDEDSPLSLRGFGTLGATKSSNENAQYVRDLSQRKGSAGDVVFTDDTLVGIQADYRINERLQTVVQGVSHYRYDGTYTPELTWAFLKYTPSPDQSIRIGRFATEFFMLADSRMVGYSYLTVRPPVDFYANLPENYMDGVDGQITTRLGAGLIRAKLYAGVAREKIPVGINQILDLNGSRTIGASLDFQKDHWLTRLTYTRLHFQNIADPGHLAAPLIAAGAAAAARALEPGGTDASYRALGILYDDGLFQAQLAVNLTSYSSAVFENSRSAYFVTGYRIGQVTPFVGYSWSHSSAKTLNTGLTGPAFGLLNAYVAGAMAGSHRDQHNNIFGLRWDFARNMDLKAQVERVRGTSSSVGLVHEANAAWNGCTDVFSLALDFTF